MSDSRVHFTVVADDRATPKLAEVASRLADLTAERISPPARIQLSRAKGWRKPEGVVVVARPSKWGNPWRVRDGYTQEQCAERFDAYLRTRRDAHPGWMDLIGYPSDEEIRAELAGRDLACWCPLLDANGNQAPCHADVLLEIANG